ncbi:unnamed protein product [Toxocara canis]|uniref:Endoplasmic reticulum transmembrane protein n=1 Tax=Toxocara canis TaxID=6265 RepID=A0A183UHJ2_TOXCA|nr:unnamed protein product [Toxocara canis]
MSSKSLFWWRLALCVVSVAFLLLYTSQYSSYREQYAKLMYKYSQSVVHSDGLAAQLRVMVERNQRIERLIEEMRTKQSLVMKENLEKCRVLESEKMTCLTNVKECEEESKALRLTVEASENKKKNELNMEQLKVYTGRLLTFFVENRDTNKTDTSRNPVEKLGSVEFGARIDTY